MPFYGYRNMLAYQDVAPDKFERQIWEWGTDTSRNEEFHFSDLLHLCISQVPQGCLPSSTGIPPKLSWCAFQVKLVCLSSYTGASQVTQRYLPSYTGVPSKLSWCASQVTLMCLPSYTSASQVTLRSLPSSTEVPPKLYWCAFQVKLVCLPS